MDIVDNNRQLLRLIVENCKRDLEELKEISVHDARYSFVYGKMDSYVTVLEWIRENCDDAENLGLDFDIESKFPLL